MSISIDNTGEIDTIFTSKQENLHKFAFNETVARVFQNMIGRSVPGYDLILSILPIIAEKHIQENSLVYDLGASLGAVSLKLRHTVKKNFHIIAIDNSVAMTHRMQDNLQAQDSISNDLPKTTVICDDILNVDFQLFSFATLNFTLQFIQPELRLLLLTKLKHKMLDGGALLLSEKIKDTSSSCLNDLHIDFKRSQGYSEIEIMQKRQALENIMIIDTIDVHKARLHAAGFTNVTAWFQCLNFISILAY